MCELALALVPSLDETATSLLYRAIKPMVTVDDDPALQKRCYKVLYAVCQHHSEFALEQSRLAELLELLTGSLLTCHVSSRQMRLRCLDCLVGAFDPSNQ